MGPRAKVQMLLDINNPTNTLVGCEYQVTKVLARKWWKTFGKTLSEDHNRVSAYEAEHQQLWMMVHRSWRINQLFTE